jgi:hypothetical protein
VTAVTDVDVVELLQRQLAAGQSLQQCVSELAQADPKLAPIVQLITQREEDARRDLEQDNEQMQLEQQELELLEERRRQGACCASNSTRSPPSSMRCETGSVTSPGRSARARRASVRTGPADGAGDAASPDSCLPSRPTSTAS